MLLPGCTRRGIAVPSGRYQPSDRLKGSPEGDEPDEPVQDGGRESPASPLASIGRDERPCGPEDERERGDLDGDPAEVRAEPWADPNVEQFLRISAQVLRRKQISQSANGEEGQ